MTNESKKRIPIVTLKLVREKLILYAKRRITSPGDAVSLFRDYMGDLDREHFVLIGLNVKNEPVVIENVRIGSLSASIVHPREVFKSAILSNSACIMGCVITIRLMTVNLAEKMYWSQSAWHRLET